MTLPGPPPPELSTPLAQAAARLGTLSPELVWYEEVSSTNDVAAVLAEHGEPEGRVVAANAQLAGRGRHGRTWISPPGAGIYASVVLRPRPSAVPLLTIAAGLAIAEGIERATGLRLDLKWPNDVHAGRRKVAGVLAEASSSAYLQHVIVGFGINVMRAAYPPEVASRATSLEEELGRAVDRGLVLAECLSSLATRYDGLQRGCVEEVRGQWRLRAGASLGRRVRWNAAERTHEGVAEDIDADGALLVRTGGAIARIASSEVTWL